VPDWNPQAYLAELLSGQAKMNEGMEEV
jgi:hypothetical protein